MIHVANPVLPSREMIRIGFAEIEMFHGCGLMLQWRIMPGLHQEIVQGNVL
jgi:hypothetical protein